MIKKAVILCGGLATRFLPITKSIPKEMLPVLNKPAIEYCIDDLKSNGVTDILVILGRNKECLETYFDRNIELEERLTKSNKTKELEYVQSPFTDVNVSFIRQIDAKGTGYAVSKAKTWVGDEPFVLMFPDELLLEKSQTKQLFDEYKKVKSSIIPLKKVEPKDFSKYGMVDFDTKKDSIVINNIVEKPAIEDSPSDMCYLGGGVFTSEIFTLIEKCETHSNGEIYLTDAFYALMKKHKLYGKEIVGERIDLGNPLGLIKGNIMAGLNNPTYSEELKELIKDLAKDL